MHVKIRSDDMKKPLLNFLMIDDLLRAAIREDVNGEDVSGF